MRVIRLDRNAGYSRAINLAAREAAGDALVLLNDDSVCDPGYVDAIVAKLDPAAGRDDGGRSDARGRRMRAGGVP